MAKKILLSVLVVLLTLAGAEGSFRLWLRVRGAPFDPRAERNRFVALREAALGRFSGEGAESVESVESGATGENGDSNDDPEPVDPDQRASWLRSIHPYFAFDKGEGTRILERDLARGAGAGPERYAVLILGGSVAAGFGNMGAETLKEVLGRDPRFEGRQIDVLGYGVAAFKEPQQVLLLAYLFSVGLRFDAVINLDGFNEVVLANANAARGVNPNFPSYAQWARLATDWTADAECVQLAARMHSLKQSLVATADAALASPLRWSAIYTRQRAGRIERLRLEAAECQDAFVTRTRGLDQRRSTSVTGPKFKTGETAAVEAGVRAWRESSISIQGLCAERGIPYLHVLQPTLLDAGSKVPTREEAADARAGPNWVHGVEIGYPLLRQAAIELEERGVHFFDAGGVFRDIEARIYIDSCHFDRRGNEVLAEAIGQAFLGAL